MQRISFRAAAESKGAGDVIIFQGFSIGAMATRAAARFLQRRLLSSGGKALGEEEKAAENVYIKKMEQEKLEKLARKVLGFEPTSHLSGAQVLPRWFSSLASNGSQVQKSQISETHKSGGEMKQSDAQRSSEGATPKVLAFSPLEAAIAKPRSSPLTLESHRVRRSEILTQVTFYMIPALLPVSKNSISTSLLVGAVFHQVYMFHKEILLDYVHHDITRKWALIYLKLLLLVMAKDTIVYFNLF